MPSLDPFCIWLRESLFFLKIFFWLHGIWCGRLWQLIRLFMCLFFPFWDINCILRRMILSSSEISLILYLLMVNIKTYADNLCDDWPSFPAISKQVCKCSVCVVWCVLSSIHRLSLCLYVSESLYIFICTYIRHYTFWKFLFLSNNIIHLIYCYDRWIICIFCYVLAALTIDLHSLLLDQSRPRSLCRYIFVRDSRNYQLRDSTLSVDAVALLLECGKRIERRVCPFLHKVLTMIWWIIYPQYQFPNSDGGSVRLVSQILLLRVLHYK